MAAGTREKIIVIEVSGEQHLIGVTSNQINHLTKLENLIHEPVSTPGANFKDKLTQALAGKIQSGMQVLQDKQSSKGQRDE
jgi:flagellar protein FliO/FliZ